MSFSSTQELFSTKQVAQMFSVSPQTVDRWRKSGELRAFVFGLGHPRYTRQAVNDFIEANEKARAAIK